jgi:ABC-type nickel/cobalt efflux system permease component RcnA
MLAPTGTSEGIEGGIRVGAVPSEGPLLAFALAFFLGLRHATDPDHLTALLVLSADGRSPGPRAAGSLGLAWGVGHALTCTALGLGVVWLRPAIPVWFQPVIELVIGLVIVVLAVRLLQRWRRGYLHAHPHRHGGVLHSHPHAHEARRGDAHPPHRHTHAPLGRSPRAAFGVGLLHGAGGSAAAAALLVAPQSDVSQALALLACFAGATILAMATVSAGLGAALASRPVALRFERVVQWIGVGSLCFGAWYAADAVALAARGAGVY